MKKQIVFPGIVFVFFMITIACNNAPIQVCPDNPHYFFYKGKPIVLVTSDHHYGAVIDKDFDFMKYFEYLANNGMNLTRIYPGGMFEPSDKYLTGNPLGPRPGRQLLPWAKSANTGTDPLLAESGQPSYKYDLDKWNPQYFIRLKAFMEFARKKDIIVEIAFFNGMYADCWPLMAMYNGNNIQNVGQYNAADCGLFTTIDGRNQAVIKYQKAYIKKIVTELNEYENLIFDICDEPSLQGLPDGSIIINPDSVVVPWINAMKEAYLQAEESLPKKHLLGQTVQNLSPDLSNELWCKWLPTEYIKPAERALNLNYKNNKPIINVESNYFGTSLSKERTVYDIVSVRLEGWWFMLGRGAGSINLNGEYYRGQETGGLNTQKYIVPQKKVLHEFMYSLDFIKMSSFTDYSGTPPDAFSNAIAENGKQYALYLFHGAYDGEWGMHFIPNPGNYRDILTLNAVPAGAYMVEWIDPASGSVKGSEHLTWAGGNLQVITPSYPIDIVLRICKDKLN
jgi:hypothetical protein